MTSLAAPRMRFPLAVAVVALAFLGLFLLYPLLDVFSASFLDPQRRALDARATTPRSWRAASTWAASSTASASARRDADHDRARACRSPSPRAAAGRRQVGAARARRPAARAAVLRRGLCARAAARPRRHRRRSGCAISACRSPRSTAPAASSRSTRSRSIPMCSCRRSPALKAIDVSVEEASQNLGASRWRGFLDRHPAARHARRCSPARCSSSSRRWRISACRSCSPRTSRSSRSRPTSCSSARPTSNPASAGVLGVLLIILHGARAPDPAPLSRRAAALPPARAARRRCCRRRRPALRRWRRLLLERGARLARAVLRRRRDLAS